MLKTTFSYDHYFLYDELTCALQQLADMRPDLMRLSSLARTPYGREVWLAEITDPTTGPAESKPALYVDGTQHAGEVTASMVAMHFIDFLITNAEKPEVAETLRDRTFYVIPRVAMDGAELYLTTAA